MTDPHTSGVALEAPQNSPERIFKMISLGLSLGDKPGPETQEESAAPEQATSAEGTSTSVREEID